MTEEPLPSPEASPEPAATDGADSGWSQDKQGREYVPARGRSGLVYRKGNETPEEAHARDQTAQSTPKDRRPRKRSSPKVPKAPAPTQTSLKELEFLIAEALKSPAMICVAMGDQWPADHMMQQAPVFARNLTKAAEHNPWLRAKLEAAVHGEDFMVKILTSGAVAGAAFMYLAPVLIYYFNPKFVPVQAREMLGVPDRDQEQAKLKEEALRAAQAATRAEAPSPVAAAAA